MKKLFASFFMITFLLITLHAQRNKDVLYLRNGSKIYGKLLEATDSLYKIKTIEGSIFIFPTNQVQKFVNESAFFDGRKKNGIGISLEAGFLIGAQSSQYKSPFSFSIIGNITHSTNHIFGLGSGVEYLGEPFTPLFLEYKYLLSGRKSTPFLFIRGGELFHLKSESESSDYMNSQYNYSKSYKGGASFTIGTGISWAKDEGETYLSFAYRYAHTSYTQNEYNRGYVTYNNKYNRLEVKLGFKF